MTSSGSLNHVYRLIWSQALGIWVAVAEISSGRGKTKSRSVVAAALTLAAGLSLAGPTGGVVASGSGSISQNGTTTTINQSSQTLNLNWQSFNVAVNEKVNFVQPSASAVAVNRIYDTAGSQIMGQINANGQVYLINPNGILFGKDAQVNVGGLVASTLDLQGDASGSTRRFSGSGTGTITNLGKITATGDGTGKGGYVALLGNTVSNQGSIQAHLGTVALGAGKAIVLTMDAAQGTGLVHMQIDESTLNTLAANGGLIQADGGKVWLSAGAKDSLLASVVNNTGVIEAHTVENHEGTIVLMGGMAAGTVNVAGTLDASAPTGGNGGFIETSAAKVKVADAARITTAAAKGKTGTWLIDPVDFNIAASGGDMTGAALSSQLQANNVTIESSQGGTGSKGDLNVNDSVSWSSDSVLTLNAYNYISVKAAITASGNKSGLVLNFGNYTSNGSARADTNYNIAAPITLSGSNASLVINGASYTLLHSMAQLENINRSGLSGNYALAQDLDASGLTYRAGLVGGGISNPFAGSFAGLGHTISNLTINATDANSNYVGLFTENRGTIRDIGLVGGSVTGWGAVGALVGHNYRGTISKAYATGNVTGSTLVGGLVGANNGAISDSYATGRVAGSDSVGGLVGANYSGTVDSAYATGDVSGRTQVGGLVGHNNFVGKLNNTYASGIVSGTSMVGGLVGYNQGTISNAYWDVSSTKQSVAGGADSGTLTNVNSVTSSTATSHTNYANFGNWSETASGSGVWVASDARANKQWVMIDGATRPMLYSEYSTSIRNAHQLQLMALDLNANYALVTNIDASATAGVNDVWNIAGFAPVGVGSNQFNGTFDGRGHTISKLIIDRSTTAFVGLFGVTGSNATISNVGLVGGSIKGSSFVGGLVGWNVGGISNAYATGAVTGRENAVGGLIGRNVGRISNAYATGAVTGRSYVGGLVGTNDGTIGNAYATGAVKGSDYVGGLVGDLGGTINTSFWLNSVSSVGIASNYGTVDNYTRGLSASEATSARTYTNAGWDVATTGGSSSVWRIYDGSTMPLLRSFLKAVTVTAKDVTKTYDGTKSLGTASYTVNDNNADTKLIYGTASYGDTSSKNVGNYSAKLTGLYSDQQGYDIKVEDGKALITAKELSVTGLSVDATKVYDGNKDAGVKGTAALSGVVTGETVTTAGTATATYNSKDVASASSVAFAGVTITDSNYSLKQQADQAATITAKELSVTGLSVDASKVYDGKQAAVVKGTAALSGVVTGETVTSAGTATATYNSKDVASASSVAFAGVTITDSNYSLKQQADQAATITAKEISVTGLSVDASKVYDGKQAAVVKGTAALSGVVTGEIVTTAGTATATYNSKDVASASSVAFVGVTITDSNYSLKQQADQAATITAKELSVTGLSVDASKVYDGKQAAVVKGTAALSGVVTGEIVTTAGTATATYNSKDVASANSVAFAGVTIADSNYSLKQQADQAATITAKEISVTGLSVDASKVYDGKQAAVVKGSASVNGVVQGDNVALGGTATATYNSKDVKDAKTVAFAGVTITDSNYSLKQQADQAATITAKSVTVTGITVSSKTYDGGTVATVSTNKSIINGLIANDDVTVSATGTFVDKNAAKAKTVTLASSYSGADKDNYTFTDQATAKANIDAKAVTVAGITASNKTYDGSNAATVSTNKSIINGLIANDDVTVSATGTFSDKNAGTGKAVTLVSTYGGNDAGNYTFTSQTTAKADIDKATLVYQARPAEFFTGLAPSGLSGNITGFVAGESLTSILAAKEASGTAVWTTSATTSSVPGSYAINGSGLSATNYDFQQASSNATALSVKAGSLPDDVLNTIGGLKPNGGNSATPINTASFDPNALPATAAGDRIRFTNDVDDEQRRLSAQDASGDSGLSVVGQGVKLPKNYIYASN